MLKPFGRLLLDAAPRDALGLEREAGLSGTFMSFDRLLDHVVRRSLAGDRVAELTTTRARGHQLSLPALAPAEREWTARERSRDAIQTNGFWTLPEKASLRVGLLSTPWSLRERGRFGPQISTDERARLPLDTSEAILVWSTLIPALALFYRPIYLRTVESGEANREDQLAEWSAIADALDVLGLRELPAFDAIRYGSGWSRLRAKQRHQALLDYCAALRYGLPDDTGARLRTWLARPLVEKYYARARKDGTALQKRVIIAALRPSFIGIWGGNWTGFVAYLGEAIHPQEHVATALPSIELVTTPAVDFAAVADSTGTTADDVAAIAAALFGADASDASGGPDRVDVLRRFWDVFDTAHARQKSGGTSLWGLVDSGTLGPVQNDSGVYVHGLYRARIPLDLVSDIEALWGGHVWTRHPERTVTEWSPHARMAEAFGAAIKFWEGVALTAWFICEGPSSRTTFSNLPEYYAREIAALCDAGAPVDPAFLASIRTAERLLGPPQPIWDNERSSPSDSELFTLTIRTSSRSRRNGFEKVRDIVTTARREWADRYLDGYLRAQRTRTLEGAAERFHVLVNARGGKTPTIKQVAKQVAASTNLWLGGNLDSFYRLVGEKCPLPIKDGRRVTRQPDLALADLHARFASFGVKEQSTPEWTARQLLKPATDYVRWLEGTGEAPAPKRIGDLSYYKDLLGSDADKAWSSFVAAIEATCFVHPPQASPSPTPLANLESAASGVDDSLEDRQRPPPRSTIEPTAPRKPWWRRLFSG